MVHCVNITEACSGGKPEMREERATGLGVSQVSEDGAFEEMKSTHPPDLMPPDTLVYCSRSCEEEPKGSMSLAYESDRARGVDCTEVGGESEATLVARAWSRRASD